MSPVTLDTAGLADALRVSQTVDGLVRVDRLLQAAKARVERFAPNAPDAVQDQAVVMLARYMLDAHPETADYMARSASFANSGAKSLLATYRRRVMRVIP